MARVGIVCDSCCDLGLDYFKDNDVEMVPLKVQIGTETFLDWVELEPTDFYKRHSTAQDMPTTSQPTPADFAAAYQKLADEGVEGIVAVILTSALSGTHQSAMIAADDAPVPVHVIDTKVVSAATGLTVKAAVEARDAGGTVQQVFDAADAAAKQTRLFFVLDTMEYLVKGGRAGKATGLAASVLNIKPILTFNDEGIIEAFKKERGQAKAFAALAEYVAEQSKTGKLRLMTIHAVAPDTAKTLQDALDAAGADYEFDGLYDIGSVIGNYAGSNAVGVAYVPLSRG